MNEKNEHRAAPRRALGCLVIVGLFACLLSLTGGVGGTGGAPARADASCGRLDVHTDVITSFSKVFASQFDKKLRIAAQRGGSSIRGWQAQLYTFSGFLLGESKIDKKMSRRDHATIPLKIGLQPGKYTLVTKGTQGGCGFIERAEVINFRSCLSKLPISFVGKPGGKASDYGQYVSVKVAPQATWAPLSDITATLSNFNGDVFGKAELPRGARKLIGEQFLNFKLKRGGLQSGRYSVFVSGKARQPRQCGNVSKSTTLRFR